MVILLCTTVETQHCKPERSSHKTDKPQYKLCLCKRNHQLCFKQLETSSSPFLPPQATTCPCWVPKWTSTWTSLFQILCRSTRATRAPAATNCTTTSSWNTDIDLHGKEAVKTRVREGRTATVVPSPSLGRACTPGPTWTTPTWLTSLLTAAASRILSSWTASMRSKLSLPLLNAHQWVTLWKHHFMSLHVLHLTFKLLEIPLSRPAWFFLYLMTFDDSVQIPKPLILLFLSKMSIELKTYKWDDVDFTRWSGVFLRQSCFILNP